MAVLLVLFAFAVTSPILVVPLVFGWGVASFALVPPLQTLVVQQASAAPNLAAAMNIGAFNLGNALGAALGALIIDAGLRLHYVPLAGAATAVAGFVMAGWFMRSRAAVASVAAQAG